ncbi:MAG TPA: hypothetical protein VFO76_01475 [Candidatus Kapabacteria bacterium]|nr:hypothetical protein [Candidatus Kapabacteria bacterium]
MKHILALLFIISLPVIGHTQSKSPLLSWRNMIHPAPYETIFSGKDYLIEWNATKPFGIPYMVIYTQKGNFTIGPGDSAATSFLWHVPDTLQCNCAMYIKDGATNGNIAWVDTFFVVASSDVREDHIPQQLIISPQGSVLFGSTDLTIENPDRYELYSLTGQLVAKGAVNDRILDTDISQHPKGVYQILLYRSAQFVGRIKMLIP